MVSIVQAELDAITKRVGLRTVDVTQALVAAIEAPFDPLNIGFYRDKVHDQQGHNSVHITLDQGCALRKSGSSWHELRIHLIATGDQQARRVFDVEIPN